MGIAFKLGECGNKIQLQFMMKMIELSNVYIIEGFKLPFKDDLFGEGNHKKSKDLFDI